MAAPDGTPVPILFNGTFPVRNTILPTSADPRQWVVHRHTGGAPVVPRYPNCARAFSNRGRTACSIAKI